MVLARVQSGAVVGVEALPVAVELHLRRGTSARAKLVGKPDRGVRESLARVRPALFNSGFYVTRQRVTINLAPATFCKAGPHYDLPLAVAHLLATGQVQATLDDALVVGELSLDGSVRPVSGTVAVAQLARRLGLRRLFVPAINAMHAALVPDVEVYPVASLIDLVAHLRGERSLQPAVGTAEAGTPPPEVDIAQVQGQAQAKRALEIAAAGGHHLLLRGPPGVGKTMLARALPGLLPPMTVDERLEVTTIYDALNLLPQEASRHPQRPFRTPHHTISQAGLVGSARHVGEVTLAHRGVLLLDELAEFGPHTLNALRQPLEERRITLGNAEGSRTLAASFLLVATMNPCPCGYADQAGELCICTPAMVRGYQARLSGPLLERFDLHVEVAAGEWEPLAAPPTDSSAAVRERVTRARAVQQDRFAQWSDVTCNSEMGVEAVRHFCTLDEVGMQLMQDTSRFLSARGYHRVLKVARTIADLVGEARIAAEHVAEALRHR